jgi:UDP-GlcNAc:undecaprenyl-phosphate GlcNAc-1-phosphate transferase
MPADRRVHKIPVPRLGGVGIFLSFVITSASLYVTIHGLQQKEVVTYWLFLVASLLIVAVHAYDDVKGLKPIPKLIAQTLSVLIILGPFNGRFNGVLLYGLSNPFRASVITHHTPWYRLPELTLFITKPDISLLAIPAVLFTWFWMVGMMNTVNFIDGLDGLATGVVGITGIFITIISWMLGQQSIAILAAIFTGATFGFLPHNWNPAKIFMGDTGSQFLGLGLAVLSIIGGAKVALALMVLGIPILDVAVVAINRIRRGQHPLHYDKTHLHHRFLATGLSVKQICYVMYGLTILFGTLALNLPRIYKPIGIVLVGLTMTGLIVWMDYRQRKRGVHIKLDGPDPTPKSGGDNVTPERVGV